MIDINLIPQAKRKKRRGQLLDGIKISLEVILGSFVGVVILLIFIHVSLLLFNLFRLNQHKNLQKQWDVIEPAKENVDIVIKEMRDLQSKQKSINEITTESRVLWSQKLNIISDSIVRGVWLTRLRLNEGTLYIEGGAISKQSDQMVGVHSFTSNLKNNKTFLENFTNLELGSIQRRYVGKTEVADFFITAELIQEEEEAQEDE